VAQLTGISEVTLGYERSADEGNGVYVENTVVVSDVGGSGGGGSGVVGGVVDTVGCVALDATTPGSADNVVKVVKEEVNHQYDKSSFFLALAQGYIAGFIDAEIKVVSTLHGLWELQVSTL